MSLKNNTKTKEEYNRDTTNEVSKLTSLYDIENCPPNLLKYMASLIGWELKGSSVEGWRRQIRFATDLYKQKGTKEGIYNALTTVLPATSFESSRISEFYESYIPFTKLLKGPLRSLLLKKVVLSP